MHLLNEILFILSATGTLLSGLLIVYGLLRFILLTVIPDEIENFRSWREERNNDTHIEYYKEMQLPPSFFRSASHPSIPPYRTISEEERKQNEFERDSSESSRFS